MTGETILILDFGGQYKELIARRVREHGVYSEIRSCKMPVEEIRAMAPKGIIFTGGPDSVYRDDSPTCDKAVLELGIPVLGICYGMQLICHLCGGTVEAGTKREYGVFPITLDTSLPLFSGCTVPTDVLMSHTDLVTALPEGFRVAGHTDLTPVAAYVNEERRLYGVQFHPEVTNTLQGNLILKNFLFDICGCAGDYSMESFLETKIREIREQVGSEKVLLGLSGGVDSSVCAALLARAVPGQLTCIYVDHGLMRQGETEEIRSVFENKALDFRCVDAADRFLAKLEGVTDPEQKRKIIGREFALVFEGEAKKLGKVGFLAQGTIYPDVVESGTGSAVIKSHHNVGGLPKDLGFSGVVEPLRYLFKDEVRKLGLLLGLPESLVNRQPFPGPGLRDHARKARHSPPGGRHRPRGDRQVRLPRRPVFCGAHRREERRRHGRRTHVRLHRCGALRGDKRLYDLRVRAPAVGCAAAHLLAHYERSARHQPRCLRHHLQAARDHRMGVTVSP